MAAPEGNKYAVGLTDSGRPPKFDSPSELLDKITEYFDSLSLSEEDKDLIKLGMDISIPRPTMTGMALYLGFCSRQSLYDYDSKDEFSYIIKRARLVIENNYEQGLESKSPTGAIFALKNMGWKDKTETTSTVTNITPPTPEELEEARKKLNDII